MRTPRCLIVLVLALLSGCFAPPAATHRELAPSRAESALCGLPTCRDPQVKKKTLLLSLVALALLLFFLDDLTLDDVKPEVVDWPL